MAVKNRSEEAIVAFKKAEKIGTRNMWLYTNWGLAHENANRIEAAIEKYRTAILRAPKEKTPENISNNRGASHAFDRLRPLLEAKKDWKAIDELYLHRVTNAFGERCENAHYARFKLFKMNQLDEAIKRASDMYRDECEYYARPVLAAAYLAKWAFDTKLSGEERKKVLNRAQALITSANETVVDLASSPFTSKALPKLKEAGIQIDAIDADDMTPLAYAVSKSSTETAERLIEAGANVNRPLRQGWTVLMIAAAADDPETVKALIAKGANPEQKAEQGQTAYTIARANGHREIMKILNSRRQY